MSLSVRSDTARDQFRSTTPDASHYRELAELSREHDCRSAGDIEHEQTIFRPRSVCGSADSRQEVIALRSKVSEPRALPAIVLFSGQGARRRIPRCQERPSSAASPLQQGLQPPAARTSRKAHFTAVVEHAEDGFQESAPRLELRGRFTGHMAERDMDAQLIFQLHDCG